MTRYKYIIPVLFLVISLVTSWSIVSGRKRAVERMLNDAGRDHLPVVVVAIEEENAVRYMISAPDHNPVNLMTGRMNLINPHMYITEDGTVRILKGQSTSIDWTSLQIDLPAIHVTEGEKFSNEIYAVYSAFHLLDNLYGVHSVATMNPTGFQIDDFETGESAHLEFESDPPGYAASTDSKTLIQILISENGSVLIGTASGYGERNILWRYDIDDGEWTTVIKREDFRKIGVSPDGSVIGITFDRHGPKETIFIDGFNGETLHTVYGIDNFIIGTRWIACREGSPGHHSGIILIDMGNHWYERRITFPTVDFQNFVMYEPPEGGVGEMLRMREDAL